VTLTEVRAAILRLIKDDPYISKAELAKEIGVHPSVISRNIEALRGKYLRRVGPDKGGFWVIIKWAHP
jgi:ATP-dependent DNA helicase RecG